MSKYLETVSDLAIDFTFTQDERAESMEVLSSCRIRIRGPSSIGVILQKFSYGLGLEVRPL